jgi:NAD(P)-dependent dehydrogenase (short-subunit alcohol dehydrogenase family)
VARSALVTGAARGIGRRVAEVLAAEGYRLVLVDLQQPPDGPEGEWVVLDVSSEAAVAAAAERVGPVDVLVNNAGISLIARAEETTLEQWRRVLEVNLTGPFLLSRAFGRAMLERGEGSIVNVASVAGLLGVAQRAAYNASKHGLIGLTRTLAAEWGGRGVRANAVCPGWVKTEMDAEDQAAGGGYTDEDIESHVPMGRFATPDDVAQAVAFLADPARSGFVNGATLSVDGGWAADGGWQSLKQRSR